MANQSRQTRENKETIWSADLRVKVGQTVKHSASFWVNLTGLNSEPGVGADFEPQGTPAIVPVVDTSLADSPNPLENSAIKSEFDRTNDAGIIIEDPLSSIAEVNALNYKSIVKVSGTGKSITINTGLDDDFNLFFNGANPLTFIEGSNVVFEGELTTTSGSIIINRPIIISRLSGTNIFIGSFTALKLTGWAWFVDNQYTVSSPLVITQGAGNKAVLTNNSNTVDATQWNLVNILPFNYLTNKLQSFALGAKFNVEIRFKAKSSDVNGKFNIFLDIGTAGSPLIANQKTEIFSFGANAEQFFTMELNYFAGSNLMANGGLIYIESTLGTTSIYDIDFLITLDHTPF
jgi:hypothetical protein